MPDSTEQQMQRRITTAAFLTGGSIALWVIPIGLLFVDATRGVYVLASGLATALSVATFLVGLVFRAQRYNAAWREQADSLATRRHDELIQQTEQIRIEALRWHTHLLRQVAEDHDKLHKHLTKLAESIGQGYWNVYSDVATDLVGGQEVVNGTTTVQIDTPVNGGKVLPMPRAYNGKH